MAFKCPECDTENPSDSRFCKNCAAPLPHVEEATLSCTETLEIPTEKMKRGNIFAGRYEIIEELGKGGMDRFDFAWIEEMIALPRFKALRSKVKNAK